MTLRRSLLALVVTVAVVVIAVVVGRHERSREYDRQLARIVAVYKLVGTKIDTPGLSAFRADPGFLCLFYAEGRRFFAMELCYDPQGRLIEAVDRRGAVPVYGSVAFRPELAPVRVAPEELLRVLLRHKVMRDAIAIGGL